MSELSFLIELLLNHDLPKETKALIAERIKEVETNITTKPVAQSPRLQQSASTIAAMARQDISPIAPAVEPVINPAIDEDMRQRSMAAALKARRNAK